MNGLLYLMFICIKDQERGTFLYKRSTVLCMDYLDDCLQSFPFSLIHLGIILSSVLSLWHYLFYPSIPNKVGLIYESLEAILCRLDQIIPILCYIKQLWMLKQIRNSPSLRFCKSHFILQWHTCLSLNPVFFFADSREYHI